MNHLENRYHERLRFDGFRIFNADEDYLFYRIGKEQMLEVMNAAFDYSCLEAEFLKMKKKGRHFYQLCENNRRLGIKSTADYIDEQDKKCGLGQGQFKFEPFTETQMREQIVKKYKEAKIHYSNERRKKAS